MIITGDYAASNLFMKQGITIDLAKNCFTKFRKLFSLFTFNEGCKSLPKADYLLLFRTLYAKCESCSIEDFNASSTVQLSIVYNRNRKLIVHESKNMAEALEMAKNMAKEMHLKIKDSASDRRNPKWLA